MLISGTRELILIIAVGTGANWKELSLDEGSDCYDQSQLIQGGIENTGPEGFRMKRFAAEVARMAWVILAILIVVQGEK